MVIEMENLRRSLNNNRSRDPPQQPGLKKPRLTEDPLNRLVGQLAAVAPGRFSRDAENNDSIRSEAYQPQMPNQHQELVSQYRRALAELTFNSKPIITNLTIIAGENQHAAKAIAATLCTHIIEIPNEQKLPSLYLLDSIVKNIGKDYIKYFATSLPEVFCMAYRHISPTVHSSMRHLFGTWKDVFPTQTLQAIERDLGFTPTVNGSSTGAATSRSDPQSQQRPPHSIHVNPKYLERQRLQQSSKSKEIGNEPTEDVEMSDRAANVRAVHSWQPLKDPRSEPVQEKNIGEPYGDPGFSRTPGLGVGRAGGRVTEQVNGRVIGGVPEAISGRGNGVNSRRALPNSPAIRSSNLQPTQSISGRSRSGMSSSWKNSEEEEFLWDMHSRLPDSDAANHSKKDWSDDSEKLEFDRENSADSLSSEQKEQATYGHRVSSAGLLQDSHLMCLGTPTFHLESHSTGLPTSGSSSLVRAGVRPKINSSHVGALGHQKFQPVGAGPLSGRPSRPPSPLLPSRLKSLVQDSGSLDTKTSQRGGPQSKSSNIRSAKSQKLQNQDLPSSSPSVSSFQISCRFPIQQSVEPETTTAEPPGLNHKPPPTPPTTESTSSLLAAVLSSGVLSNPSIAASLSNQNSRQIGQKPSQSLVKPPLSSSRLPPIKVALLPPARASSTPLDSAPVRATKAASDTSDPVSNLLSSLVKKGLISASEKELPTKKPPQSQGLVSASDKELLSKKPPQLSSVPISAENSLSSATALSEPSAKISVSLPQASTEETKSLIGLVFKPNLIREFHPHVVSALFEDLSYECSICGLKLKLQETLDRHMEWHAVLNPESNDVEEEPSRGWYANSEDWVGGRREPYSQSDSDSFMEESGKTSDEGEEPMVPADENECACILCGQLFEDYYSQEMNEWMFKGAVYMIIPFRDDETGASSQTAVNGPIVHVNCVSESSVHDLGLPGGVKLEKDT